jgi:hypothetical protein
VSLSRIADRLHVDRRVLKRLYDSGQVAGVREGGMLYLERRSLAAYLWSRSRCVVDDCVRRVIGDGPGCDRHRRSGRHDSEETKRRRVETRRHTMAETGRGRLLRVMRWRPCEREDCDNWTDQDRFCSHDCLRDVVLNRDPERLQEGHLEYRDRVERVKKQRNLFSVEDLVDRPADKEKKQKFRAGRLRRAGVPRTAAAISDYIRDGWLTPEPDLGFAKPYLFTEAAVDELVRRLRAHKDGRLTRFTPNTPELALFRGRWYQARHGSTAEAGRVATVVNKAGPKPTDLGELTEGNIRRMRAEGKTLRQIEIALHGDATLMQIRRVLAGP